MVGTGTEAQTSPLLGGEHTRHPPQLPARTPRTAPPARSPPAPGSRLHAGVYSTPPFRRESQPAGPEGPVRSVLSGGVRRHV